MYCAVSDGVGRPYPAAVIISSILLACAVCSPFASCLNENYVGTIGLLIDLVSSNRQKWNPMMPFPPTPFDEGDPI